MNILFINNIYPLFERGDSGASNRSTMFITGLTSIGHVDVISFLENEKSNVIGCDIIYSQYCPFTKKEGRFAKFLKILRPWNINALYPLNIQKESIIDKFVNKNNYDFIAVRYINEAAECGLLKYRSKLLLDLDDNPYKACLNSIKIKHSFRNKIYTHIYAIELKWHIKHIAKHVHRIYHSNPLDRPVKSSIYLHNVAICDKSLNDITESTPMQLLIVGTWHYAPNRDGIRHFLSNIYPEVREILPNINLKIVGRIYDEKFHEELAKEKNVTLVGYAHDLRSEYEDVRMVIVPLYDGTGTSIKLLEAMCINRVCISTSQGARGMDGILIPNEDYIFAENDLQFAKKIVTTIINVNKCNEISHNALEKTKKFLSKDLFIDTIKKSI